MFTARHDIRNLALIALAAVCTCLGACERPQTYSQATPDDVLKSALAMVKNNETRKLGTLIWSEGAEMKVMLARLGVLLGNMQKLSVASAEKFPEDFAAMRVEADKAAADGKPSMLLSTLMSAGRGRNARQPDPNQMRDLINQLFADPYAWLERNASRLTTIKPTDDAAFILLDGQPAIPVIGLGMRLENGKWYVQLPSNVPPISQFWPRSRPQWSILTSVMKVLNNAVEEMTEDVRTGRVTNLKTLGDRAGDKLLFPGGIAFVAYGKELEVRTRVDRQMARFNKRLGAWKSGRAESETPDRAPSAPVVGAIETVAPIEIEKGVRIRKVPDFEAFSDADFEQTIGRWLAGAGLSMDMAGPLTSKALDESVRSWEAQRARAKPSRK